ncbi:MAG: archaeosortase/exosortase family protein [Myxococcota bacterium]
MQRERTTPRRIKRAAQALSIIVTLAVAWVIAPLISALMRWGAPDAISCIALIAGLVALALRLRDRGWLSSPASVWAPAIWVLCGVGGIAAGRYWLGTPLASALAAAAALYGVAGLWVSTPMWRAMRGPSLLIMGALPIGERADQWFGLPARLMTADLVYRVLKPMGVRIDAADTILIFDSGLTNIAAACSGLRGLWTMTLLIVFIAMVEQRRVGIRLGILIGISQVAMIIGNSLRIIALVGLDRSLQLRQLAELMHEPFGLSVFAVVAVFSLSALRLWVPEERGEASACVQSFDINSRLFAATGACCLATLASLGGPLATAASVNVFLPSAFKATAMQPTPAEERLAASGRIEKWRFTHADVKGQLILLQTSVWRAQHPPELCLKMGGHRITSARDVQVGDLHVVRFLEINDGQRLAAYWYQSTSSAGPGLWPKIWSAWQGHVEDWVMVSVLFDEGMMSHRLAKPTLSALYGAVQRALLFSMEKDGAQQNWSRRASARDDEVGARK